MDMLLNLIQMLFPYIHDLKDAVMIGLVVIIGVLVWYILKKDQVIKDKDQKIEDFLDTAVQTNKNLSDVIDVLKDLIRNRR